MPHLITYVLLAIVLIGLIVAARKFKVQLRSKAEELRAFEGEEERMFAFLHDLGSAIGSDTTMTGLYRLIVDGVTKVVAAKGGQLYLLDEARQHLKPRYLSAECPALVTIPAEVRQKAEKDTRALDSHLRLAQVPADEGIFGTALSAAEALNIPNLRAHESVREVRYTANVSVMLAPLRHGGKDLGVLAVTRNWDDPAFTANDFAVFRTVAEQSAFAIGNALVHREASEKRQMEGELRNAREVQRVLLPPGDPVVPGYRVSGTNVPARIISGDYYDHLDLGEGRHGVVIADVSGKGVAAGLIMAMCRSVLRSLAGAHADPAEALGRVNRQIFPDIKEDMFISLYYAVIEGENGEITLARAGHDPALLYRSDEKTVMLLKPPGLALGIDGGNVFERVTKAHKIHMNPGDCLLFHTDGVKEATNAAGEEFGMDRLRDAFRESASLGAEASIRSIERELAKFVGEAKQADDITLVAMEKR
ncbi:SpoIIE family protein phosphatase [Luteolibacter sp. GHJ8]|uniref:SpoIIE family protein phosphatase n=1 Tax=Luteolibacter rhizosphaerae TaxID=2989719 RepID=A0ABT3FXI5_9BACT|nr:GAF domain-containing SpoIIE family protein phosphatase [Luteolibacter rhizosphaerae]MCW1912291.1 SpoIIE family protein phosphatase [Luteolibacter rhizosphaerae]